MQKKPARKPDGSGDDANATIASPTITAKTLLRKELLHQNIDSVELAQRLQISRGEMRDVLNPSHETDIDFIAKAFHALGKRLELSLG